MTAINAEAEGVQGAATPGIGRTARSEELLRIALEVLERDGLERLSVGQIARTARIKTPSLYKHFSGKREIELGLIEIGFERFIEATRTALDNLGPRASRRRKITAFVQAYRAFGLARPELYRLMNDRPLPRDLLSPEIEAEAMRDYLSLVPDRDRARSFWAWAHGLLSLEIAGRFPDDADLDAAWQILIDALTRDP